MNKHFILFQLDRLERKQFRKNIKKKLDSRKVKFNWKDVFETKKKPFISAHPNRICTMRLVGLHWDNSFRVTKTG